ncbi:MAG: hypothetical protein AB7G93_05230 [Bdellovibrionales bacterium]
MKRNMVRVVFLWSSRLQWCGSVAFLVRAYFGASGAEVLLCGIGFDLGLNGIRRDGMGWEYGLRSRS